MNALKNIAKAALIGAGAATAAVFGVSTALAETIEVRGIYAANVNLPPETQVILIDRLEGDLGQDAELALTEVLGNVIIRGERYFDVILPNALRKAVVEVEGQDGTIATEPLTHDAELRGTVRSEGIERDIEPKIERECVTRDEDGDCTERREIRIACRELTIRVDPRILLTAANGRQLYSHTTPLTRSARYCADDNIVPSELGMVNEMIDEMVAEIRRDLAPVQATRNVRVMERRRDLRREDRDAFRDAVRLTQTDVNQACPAFIALEGANFEHVSVLFNIGLCWEAAGELQDARRYYDRALAIDSDRDYPRDGLRRVLSRIRAEALLAQRDEIYAQE